jgi:hypothetical protein
MKRILNLIFVFLPLLGFSQNGEFDVRLSYESYSCSSEKVAVLVEVKSTSASTAFGMGDATLRFDYKLSEVINPVLKKQHNFSSAATIKDFNYQPQSLNKAEANNDGIITLNVSYVGLNDGAQTVNESWTSVATLEFDMVTSNKCVALKWHDNDRTPITGMSEVITPGSQPVSRAITGSQFLDLTYCVTDVLPEATISASLSSITEGEESKITVTLVNDQGNWSAVLSDGSTVNNSSNPSEELTVSPTTTTVYTVTSVTSICGTTNYSTDPPSAKIKVVPKNVDLCDNKPLPNVTVSASPSSILTGESSILTVTLTEGTGSWSATLSNGGTVSNSSNASESFTVSPTTTTNYIVTLLSDGCSTNPFPIDAPFATVTLRNIDPCKDKSLPTAALSAFPSSILIGESSILTVTLTEGTGDWSATLLDGSKVTNSPKVNESFAVSPTATTTYTITSVTDACGTTTYATDPPSTTVTVSEINDPCENKPLPTATVTASSSSITRGESSTLTVTLTEGTGSWSAVLSDGSTVTASSKPSEIFTVSPTTNTTYKIISVTDTCGTNTYAAGAAAPAITVSVSPDGSCVPQPCLPITFRLIKN